MTSRRDFLTTWALASAAIGGGAAAGPVRERPLVLSTWNFGQAANAAAWAGLESGGSSLDAVEAGARQAEADVTNQTVGIGGSPDRDGHVTLDACIMADDRQAGSVCFLEGIAHPVSVARRVMEATPHVMLAGAGAHQFAIEQGFARAELLTDDARERWQRWRRQKRYEPRANVENHDTLGILARDRGGRLAGACTTSGMAYKMHGRVGDSPIIGAALYVDGEVGAATATGHGEYVMRTLGSFLVVELMRQGRDAQSACEDAVARIARELGDEPGEVQVGYLAVDARGGIGAFAVQPGFQYAIRDHVRDEVRDAASWYGDR